MFTLPENWLEDRQKEILKYDTKALIQMLRDYRYKGDYLPFKLTEKDIVAELGNRPHVMNKQERKVFVQKQQKRTERKTRGAR